MATTTPRKTSRRETARRALPWLLQIPSIRDFHAPKWVDRLPRWMSTGGVLVILMAISAVIRTRYIGGQFWADEASAVGVASHSLGEIPGILRQVGATPLYYFVLHIWISLFGSGESATHGLSLLLGLASIPLGMWVGWSLGGRRAGIYAATLFALSAFLTEYAQETQAYELLALIGLVAIACFEHGFVYRRRAYLIGFAICLGLMLYTSFWSIFFWFGAAVALIPVHRVSQDRRGLMRDAGLCFAAGLILFIPWIPNLIYQMSHGTSPWGYADFVGATFPSNLLGGDRVVVTLAIGAAVGLLPMLAPARRRTPRATALWVLLTVPLAAVLLARIASLVAVTWVTRYLAPLVAPLVLLAALTNARAGIFGLIVIALSIAFVANPASYSPKHKSDMRDVAGELAPYMRPGDVVLVGMPEQSPLAWYYLPAGLRFATTMGPIKDPSYMNWTNAYTRLKDANPQTTLNALLASLKPGQRLLYARPLTEGAKFWKSSWSQLVRRRAAQWGALLSADRQLRPIAGAVAPENYSGACCVADSAIVYTKVG
jgi:hypothetical protein